MTDDAPAAPPPPPASDRKLGKPLMIFDGDCGFCRRWIVRFQEITGDRADYAPSQEVGRDFPSIPPEDFSREVKLVETDGRVSGAAEAVFRLLSDAGRGPLAGLPLWAYEQVPGVKPLTETVYHFIAGHRTLASTATRWLWGNDVRQPTYHTARAWFLRVMGAIYLVAFLSLRVQMDGLIGKNGILPFESLLKAARTQLGAMHGFALFPSLTWLIGGSDGALRFLCDGGMLLALLLIAGAAPAVCLALLWIFYLSLAVAGQNFLSFQWDVLLLETGFLSIFLAPLRWWTGWRAAAVPVSRIALFLLRWLLFRFMLMSGVVKLTSGDTTWRNFTALKYHYETQPLPTWIGWWTHQSADWWQAVSLAFVFVAELIAPFFVFGPRRVRLAGFALLVLLQILIALTGNYGFFNLLTVALCLLSLDDLQWPRWLIMTPAKGTKPLSRWLLVPLLPVTTVYIMFGAMLLWQAFFPSAGMPAAYAYIEPFRSLNGYGLFRVMTQERPEIVIEGSNDGENWQAYEFRWKPGDPHRAPRFVAPYMPRLDWQMWFAALDPDGNRQWFAPFMVRLLQGSPSVLNLLAVNPFPDKPPRYVRATLYEYHFTDPPTRRRTGDWWQRESRGLYCPPIALRSRDGE